MNYELSIRKRAQGHIENIFDWYEKQRPGLGIEFIHILETTLFSIRKKPLHFQERYKNVRCAILQRFPYGVFYFVDGFNIVVIAIFHFKRNIRQLKK